MGSGTRRLALSILALAFIPAIAKADSFQLINNGGFEVGGGSLAGWTVSNQPGSNGTVYTQSGTISPQSGFLVQSPSGPTHAAMTDQSGPGSHILFQDFLVPADVQIASLRFDRFLGNRAGAFFTPNTLDFNVTPNQQARVDILTTSADPFSVTGGVLANIFQTHPGDVPVAGYTTVTTDVSALLAAHAGQTLRLRFAEADNQGFFQFGIDEVSLNVQTAEAASAVPLPSTAIAGLGILGCAGLRGRRWRPTRPN